ncbi:hypothetical protein A4A49_20317 [Nicotiana attenuata]|uniref:Uncharacterized protein n=1 Tax=Nicotiana attenuata TaxID=49451 RepID=A0A314L7N2_NICAT|nr:hypothetical protein A4A49_20317 [Nicotiana attenuata]
MCFILSYMKIYQFVVLIVKILYNSTYSVYFAHMIKILIPFCLFFSLVYMMLWSLKESQCGTRCHRIGTSTNTQHHIFILALVNNEMHKSLTLWEAEYGSLSFHLISPTFVYLMV